MNEIIKVDFEQQTISARELHEKLNIKSKYADWFKNMVAYGFVEGADFDTVSKNLENGGRTIEHYISIDMAKQICMIQRTPEGKAVRQYLLDLEKAWNTPELVMARGLQASQKLLEQQDEIIKKLTSENEAMKPKALFADSVSASDTTILIRELAKIINQNGVAMGERRLFAWMKENGYLIKKNHSYEPTQKASELGVFFVTETAIAKPDGTPMIVRTTRVTGKGQQYFVKKFMQKQEVI